VAAWEGAERLGCRWKESGGAVGVSDGERAAAAGTVLHSLVRVCPLPVKPRGMCKTNQSICACEIQPCAAVHLCGLWNL
jgi:hypothetical protein